MRAARSFTHCAFANVAARGAVARVATHRVLVRVATWCAVALPLLLAGPLVPTTCFASAAPDRILVKFRPDAGPATRDALRASLGARRVREITLIGVEVLEVQDDVRKAIAGALESPAVEYAEPDQVLRVAALPADPRFPELWALHNTGQLDGTPGADIRAPEAWDIYTGDANVLVGIIDTGIDANHPDLAGNLWTNPGEIPGNGEDDDLNGYVDDVHGYDFFNDDGDPFDDYGHGAHVAGIIGAVANNGVGVAGVCWNCTLVGIKFLGSGGSGSMIDAIAALEYAVRIGCRITNHSYGGAEESQAFREAIEAAGRAGVLCVVAAGNSFQNIDYEVFYPASFASPYVLAVTATDQRDDLASFSSYGPVSVDVAAPGEAILSVRSGGGWIYLAGTSMATPHVTGAAALVLGRFPQLGPLQIKNRILRNVEPLASLAGLCVSGGRLDLVGCLTRVDSIPPGAVGDLTVSDVGSTTAELSWSATGDDGPSGRAWEYQVRYATSPIDSAGFVTATAVPGPVPLAAGELQRFAIESLRYDTTYWFAVRAVDEDGNEGPISNLASITTLGPPQAECIPMQVSLSLRTGQSALRALTLRNTGAGRLDYSIPPARMDIPLGVPLFAGGNHISSERPFDASDLVPAKGAGDHHALAKGAPDPRAGEPVLTGSGGPDAGGYRWIDSDEPGGPVVHWDSRGDIIFELNGDEQMTGPVQLAFDFPFYGRSFRQLRVSTNGFITFTDLKNNWSNQPLPSAAAPLNLIAPFWDDLDLEGNRRIRIHSSESLFVVSWSAVERYRESEPFTFQLCLEPSGAIQFNYANLGRTRNNCTVGIQNGDASAGLTVAFNADYLHPDLAVRIVRLPQWVEISPASGRLAAGESTDLELRIDATDLSPGDYRGTIAVRSNAVDPEPHVLVALHVDGAPDLVASPGTLNFGSVFVGAASERLLRITNSGSADLVIDAITGPPALQFEATSFQLAPRETRSVRVLFQPIATGPLSGTVSIESNDLETPVVAIPVSGAAIPAPSFTLDAESLLVELPVNATLVRPLRVTNHGGSPFVFTAEAVVWAEKSMAPDSTCERSAWAHPPREDESAVHPAREEGPIAHPALEDGSAAYSARKDDLDSVTGAAGTRAGGPDSFGYRWDDSDDPGGPVYDWQDLRGPGTRIPFAGDDENLGPFPIGFDFPFYGTTFRTFRVSTNGFVTFTGTDPAYANGPLPSRFPTAPANLLAVFWDDLDLRTSGEVWYHGDGSQLVVQFENVARRGGAEASAFNSFAVVLYPDGRILYRYRRIDAITRDSHTIGIQNGARNDGLQVAFNAPYARANLSVRFTPPARFLSVSPANGTIPPAGFLDLHVGFDATGLRGGVFRAALRISGNDPSVPVFDVPVQLAVLGAPDLETEPVAIDFGPVDIGFPQLRQMIVRNTGSEPLVVSRITTTDPVFTVRSDGFVIPAFGRALVDVGFAPRETGRIEAQLEVKSNDLDAPDFSVQVAGTGREAPNLYVVGGSLLVARLAPGDSTVRTLTLHNTGGSDLDYEIALDAGPDPQVASRPGIAGPGMETGAAGVEPRAGTATGIALGAGAATPRETSPQAATPEVESRPQAGERPGLLGKREIDPRPGIDGAGGPDAAGYRWRDSDDPGGPVYEWVPLESAGTPLDLHHDDETRIGIPLGFDFRFYGRTFSSVNVCTNGWLSFSSRDSSYSNQPLPDPGIRVPRDLVAPLWDDFQPAYGTAIRCRSEADRFVVSWIDIPHFLTGELYTFQAILRSNGRILFQYRTVPRVGTSATIGLQDDRGATGLLVSYNTDFAHDGLAIEFRNDREWLSVNASAGRVPPGGRGDVSIVLRTGDLAPGRFTGRIRVTSNDPDAGVIELPVSLFVGDPTAVEATLPAHDALRLVNHNPVRPPACFELAVRGAATVDVGIYDVRGTRVRRLHAGELVSGWHRMDWDGCDAGGRRVASGVYFAVARSERAVRSVRFALVR